jgi:hypothetical protein
MCHLEIGAFWEGSPDFSLWQERKYVSQPIFVDWVYSKQLRCFFIISRQIIIKQYLEQGI